MCVGRLSQIGHKIVFISFLILNDIKNSFRIVLFQHPKIPKICHENPVDFLFEATYFSRADLLMLVIMIVWGNCENFIL